MTADPEFGPFLESLSDAHARRVEREQFRGIVADLEPDPWPIPPPCPEPSLPRAILGALWGLVAPIVRKGR